MIRQLVEDRELIEIPKEGVRGTRKCLYVPELCEDENLLDKHLLIKIYKEVRMITGFMGLTPEIYEIIRKQRRL